MSTRQRLTWVCAAGLLAMTVGCGDGGPPSGPVAEAPTWQPAFTDPGTDVFLYDAATGATPKAETAIRTVLAEVDEVKPGGKVTVDYPFAGSVFPPDLCAATFLWHDADNTVNAWLIDVAFEGHAKHVYAVTSGKRTRRPIDPRCVTNNNVWTESAYQASAKAWTPDERTWSIIKQRSVERKATVTVYGLVGTHGASGTRTIVSRGEVSIMTSTDPVGAPIFYRDVPLMPSETKDGVIKPLAKAALPLIQWRLRDLPKPDAPVVMAHLPTCANCHTFSTDGKLLAMDMDGPQGDKGAYAVAPVTKRMVITTGETFTWNRFKDKPPGKSTSGLFAQISPDGKYVATMLNETLYVSNYLDYRFLQTFYPTRGILVIYNRETAEMKTLPGADDVDYVQGNPTWSPDGKWIVFIRAKARESYGKGPRATYANDPNETQIQYDLYRIPFNGGRGGTPEPIEGASDNGMSHSFPRVTPDGKWIVFVVCKNGMLMRPDGRLAIVPFEGGVAREMTCNTPRMNSYHSFSPNGRWMVFASKWPSPYTQMYLTHIDEAGNDTPAVLIPNSTAANRAVNLPEFANIRPGALLAITTPAVDYRRHLERARELKKKGEVGEAFAELRKSLDLKSDYPETHFELGVLLIEQGDPGRAVQSLRKAVEIRPGYFEAYGNLAVALRRQGRFEEAVRAYRRALEIRPRDFHAHDRLAVTLRRLGKFDQAVAHHSRAVELKDDYPQGHYEWGITLRRLGKPDQAVERFRRAVKVDPAYYQAHSSLGAALTDLGKSEEALKHFRKALEINPKHLTAHHDLGVCLRELGKLDLAVSHLRRALEINPMSYHAHTSLADTLNRMGKPVEAVRRFRRALEINPRFLLAHNGLAWVLATSAEPAVRDGKTALRHALIACRATGFKSPVLLDTLAAAYAETGQFADAVRYAEQALTIARALKAEELATRIGTHLALFKQGKPLRY